MFYSFLEHWFLFPYNKKEIYGIDFKQFEIPTVINEKIIEISITNKNKVMLFISLTSKQGLLNKIIIL